MDVPVRPRSLPTLGLPAAPVPPVPDVRRLAVLRSGGIGDYVVAEPAVSALRAAYPDAELTLLGAAHHRDLVVGRPAPVDRFVEVPAMPGIRAGSGPDASAAQVEDWCAGQRAAGYDLAVQLHGGGANSNRLLLRLGARVSAGAATPDAPRLDRWVPYTAFQHDTLRWLEVAAACGAPSSRLEPVLAVIEADLTEAERLLPPGGRPVLAVHPGATQGRRRWPEQRLAAVADAVAACGAQVVLLGGPRDTALADAVAAASRAEPVVLTGRLSLGGMLGLLARATMFLGNDSGPRHLAAAVGTPTVAVFTYANQADVAPLTRTWHRLAVSWTSACARCGTRILEGDCGHDVTVLGDVAAEEVTALALELWAQALDAAGPPAREPAA